MKKVLKKWAKTEGFSHINDDLEVLAYALRQKIATTIFGIGTITYRPVNYFFFNLKKSKWRYLTKSKSFLFF